MTMFTKMNPVDCQTIAIKIEIYIFLENRLIFYQFFERLNKKCCFLFNHIKMTSYYFFNKRS